MSVLVNVATQLSFSKLNSALRSQTNEGSYLPFEVVHLIIMPTQYSCRVWFRDCVVPPSSACLKLSLSINLANQFQLPGKKVSEFNYSSLGAVVVGSTIYPDTTTPAFLRLAESVFRIECHFSSSSFISPKQQQQQNTN